MSKPEENENPSTSPLAEMYARQNARPRGKVLAFAAGLLLIAVQLLTSAYWMRFGPFGLVPRFDPGFEWPFVISGFVAGIGALTRRAFRITMAAAVLSIFAIGPWALALFGGLISVLFLFLASDNAFLS